MKNIAIIPARSGSKRIPGKNIKNLLGEPVLGITLKTLVKANIFDDIIISSDSQEILDIAEKYGASKLFMRHPRLADAFTSTHDVIKDVIIHNNITSGKVCCVYPTAALLTPTDLIESNQFLTKSSFDYVAAAYEPNSSAYRMFSLDSNGNMKMLFPEYASFRSQDLPGTYADAGMFYWGQINSWLNNPEILGKNSGVYVIDTQRVVDVNTISDWSILEEKYKNLIRSNHLSEEN